MKYEKSKKAIMLIGLFCTLLSNSNATIQTMIDPSNGRTVYIDGAVKIDGCDAGLVRFETGYVCKSLIPPPPPKPPTPQPIYPPADAVCRGDYPVENDGVNEIRCASGYVRINRSHQDNAWCEITAAQKALCTVIYPPPAPTPEDPTSGPGWQGGFLGSDGQLYDDKEGTSLCSSCDRVIGHVGNPGSISQPTAPDTPDSPDSGGPVGNPGGIGGE